MTPQQEIDRRQAWTAALRSGEYQQGRGQLRIDPILEDHETKSEYCCLGVACIVAGMAITKGGYSIDIGNGIEAEDSYGDIGSYFGLTLPQVTELWKANDDGKTFAQIADMIEAL